MDALSDGGEQRQPMTWLHVVLAVPLEADMSWCRPAGWRSTWYRSARDTAISAEPTAVAAL